MDFATQIAFQVKIAHDYYQDGLARGLKISPTRSAMSQMTRFKGQLFTNPGHFGVVAPIVETPDFPDGQLSLPLGMSASFILETPDPNFFNLTEIDFVPGNILYANNLAPDGGVPIFQSLPLKEDIVSLKLKNGPDRILKVEVETFDQRTVMVRDVYSAGPLATYSVDLTAFPEGAYRVNITTPARVETFPFFKSKALSWSRPLGVFEWFGPTAPPTTGESWQTESYTLQFQARRTYWNYYVVQRNWLHMESPFIDATPVEGETVGFSQPQESNLPDGQTAVLFTSSNSLPFRQVPDWEISLRSNGEKKGVLLPYASPDLIGLGKPPGFTEDVNFTNIYVYL